ncbi:Dynamin family protein [Fictibacillus macauensis ZFHKF-1]|uniref:Dynamin family protein n=1 Tax=Fictibacillus macauensis ZFHKF-1 TaxID=1196324 RepID=I8UIZ0_9BACL|nr:dynamin family protein [Fictibacillus macauensis]EIT86855.1 Dynamin family protein [Fictibacillus macauensis ZFHKF-1]
MKNAKDTVIQDPHYKEVASAVASVYTKLEEQSYPTEAPAVLELYEKLVQQEFAIAFCGHFSAGKSTMINEIMGENILPSSPIPTSANVVKLRSGESFISVKIKDKGHVRLAPPVNLDDVKKWAKNGDDVESIEIGVGEGLLPPNVAVFDTPGIDSTDDAHKVATESALHMADVVFYVMDYNHVLSQLNFSFVRLLKEQGKKLYLIVNQIDKHNEEEISFAQFQENVIAGFRSWDIEPEEIFFTTIKEPTHKGNQLADIKTLFQKFYLEKDEWIKENALKETELMIQKTVQASLAHEEETHAEAFVIAESYDAAELQQNFEANQKQLTKLTSESEEKSKEAAKTFKEILDTAILMPFQTREAATHYIESLQAGFKVGFLFSQKKTEQARNERLQVFYESVLENIKTQISWHLKDYFHAYQQTVQSEPELTPDHLRSLVQSGASLSGNYVLQYCNDVTAAIQKMYTAHYRNEIQAIQQVVKAENENEITALKEMILKEEQALDALQRVRSIRDRWNAIQEEWLVTLYERHVNEQALQHANEALFAIETNVATLEDLSQMTASASPEAVEGVVEEQPLTEKQDVEQEATTLQKASSVLADAQLLPTIAEALQQASSRITQRSFTVSLFGAFSAGKSSFANALIGEKLLPVSPNPTTATINRILPPTAEHQHGTALITFKEEQALLIELNQSLAPFGLKGETLDEAIRAAQQKKEKVTDALRPHLQFLSAVVAGYTENKEKLGTTMVVSVADFQAFVAQEEKACFTESIAVYYDCALTRMGVTLVDTPGADSINARHTNVAFEFIKNSDAILYVTYYNHAFSAADREFLIQLGRVKDTFELDKMFFMINAADLAQDEAELEEVTSHVASNLQQFGIRNPKLFPLSSYYALLAQQNNEEAHRKLTALYGEEENEATYLQKTGFPSFYDSFTHFLRHDLAQVLLASAHKQLTQAKSTLGQFIAQAEKSEEEREQEKARLQGALQEGIRCLHAYSEEKQSELLTKEISELLFYVRQRVMLRFTEFFNEAFNSSVITGGVREQKAALASCLQELHQMIEFDLQQESRATALRVEKQLLSLVTAFNEELDEVLQGYVAPAFISQVEQLSIDTLQSTVSLSFPAQAPHIVKDFKNANHFFEQNGKKDMMERLYEQLDQEVAVFVEQSIPVFEHYYQAIFENVIESQKQEREKEYVRYIQNSIEAMDSPEQKEKMKLALSSLQAL